jgi:polyhydroxyalkanoate synthesis regulator phasin
MPATQEKPNLTNMVSEAWMQNLGNLCWAQEQGDKIVETMIAQGKVTREQSLHMAEAIAEQVKSNQQELQKWIQGSVQMSMAAFKVPQAGQVEALQQQVAELTRKVEELSKKG